MYSNEDAAFDDEGTHGPRCSKHGRHNCQECCESCGRLLSNSPNPYCRTREAHEDDGIIPGLSEFGL